MEAAQLLGVQQLVDVSPEQRAASLDKLPAVEARRARHIVEEIARVGQTVTALQTNDLVKVGKLLTASHRSSQTLFENSTPELDFLVDTLIAEPGVYGARLSGGGFGGAVMALTSSAFSEEQAAAVARAYQDKFGTEPMVLSTQTGEGAAVI